jgi:hypothetical protein
MNGIVKDGIKTQSIPTTIHGHNVIGYMSGERFADLGYADSSTLEAWYKKNPTDAHLGIVNAVSAHKQEAYPLLSRALTRAGHITVDGSTGKFTYDVAIDTSHGMYTSADMSNQQNCGTGGSIFKIVLNTKLRPGDVITYDAQGGHNAVVSAEYPVKQQGHDYVHYVKYLGQSQKSWFPSDKLRAGIRYFKTGHLLGEYSTQFSGISAINSVDMARCEFILGNHRGVEASTTMYAGERLLKNMSKKSTDFIQEARRQIESWGALPDGNKVEKVFYGQRRQNEKGKWVLDRNNTVIMDAIQYLAFAELIKIEETGLMFQRGGLIEDNNSVIRANEGLWYQLLRGYTISYSRPGGLLLTHLQQASEYIYRNDPHLPIEKRYMRFDCGKMAYENAARLVQNEFGRQLNFMAPLLGGDMLLPKNPVSGTLDNLQLDLVRAEKCFLPGIGYVEFRHQPSYDMMPMTDVHSRGFYGADMPWTSYSMCIEDYTDRSSTNAYISKPDLGNNVKMMKPGTNLYYITPEQGSLYWGNQYGRWSSTETSNIIASRPGMDQTFFCHSRSALWLSDPSRIVLIHLNRAA